MGVSIPDSEILEAIDVVAAGNDGYVTHGAVARALGMAKSGVHRRIRRLIDAGQVEDVPGRPGSIRRV